MKSKVTHESEKEILLSFEQLGVAKFNFNFKKSILFIGKKLSILMRCLILFVIISTFGVISGLINGAVR